MCEKCACCIWWDLPKGREFDKLSAICGVQLLLRFCSSRQSPVLPPGGWKFTPISQVGQGKCVEAIGMAALEAHFGLAGFASTATIPQIEGLVLRKPYETRDSCGFSGRAE